MRSIFSLDNPIWKFVANLADFFLLSVLWFVCSLPIITIGAATTACYYVTLKMASNQEGTLAASFFRSFRQNFRQATVIWLIFLALGAVIGLDGYWCLQQATVPAYAFGIVLIIVSILYLICLSFLFPMLARCENSLSALLKMGCAIAVKHFLPVLSTVLVTAGFFLIGLFLCKVLLLVTPALAFYINSFIFNHIFAEYGWNLKDQ